jgi:hypothetical protein
VARMPDAALGHQHWVLRADTRDDCELGRARMAAINWFIVLEICALTPEETPDRSGVSFRFGVAPVVFTVPG